MASFVGVPVRARTLILSSGSLSPRLRATLRRGGATLSLTELGTVSDPAVAHTWAGDAGVLVAATTARSLVFFPVSGEEPARGVPSRPLPAPVRVLSEPISRSTTLVRLGKADRCDGGTARVGLSLADLTRHCHILGQTGTGKSSLLDGME